MFLIFLRLWLLCVVVRAQRDCLGDPSICSVHANCTIDDFEIVCTCLPGYHGDGTICEDINECEIGTHNCATTGAQCSNTEGSFNCSCKEGYVGDGLTCTDINECTEGFHNCHSNAACTNFPGNFYCDCKSGYFGDGVNCTDVDECEVERDDCDINAGCNNFNGGFNCSCKTGYIGNGSSCSDLDECMESLDNCNSNARCINTERSFFCECEEGYGGDGVNCTDINECILEIDDCDKNAGCVNEEGSFRCICQDGFFGDGRTCSDINECVFAIIHKCHENSNCANTIGSFLCTCKEGYSDNETKNSCEDINECEMNTHNCDANAGCSNNDGSFSCACFEGYTGDGNSCTDVDECTSNLHDCDENADCFNSPGGYDCVCKQDYRGSGKFCELITCRPPAPVANSKSICYGQTIGFNCQYSCDEGYVREGPQTIQCSDLNRDKIGEYFPPESTIKCRAYTVLKIEKYSYIGVKGEDLTIEVTVLFDFTSEEAQNWVRVADVPGRGHENFTLESRDGNILKYSYTFKNISEEYAGSYSIASRSVHLHSNYSEENKSVEIQVTVDVPVDVASMTISPTLGGSFTYIMGSPNNTLKCSSRGTPTPQVTWKFSSSNVFIIYGPGEATLYLGDASFDDQDSYTCVSVNRVGEERETRSANLSVNIMIEGRPVIENKKYVFAPRDDWTLICDVASSPAPNVTWKRSASNHTYTDDDIFIDVSSVDDANNDKYYTFSSRMHLRSQLCMGKQSITCDASNKHGVSEDANEYTINEGNYFLFEKYYYYHSNGKASWKDLNVCEDLSGSLIEISSTKILEALKENGQLNSDFFVGASYQNGTWRWDKSGEEVAGGIKGAEEPQEGLCAMYLVAENQLKSVDCEEEYDFICQLPASGVPDSLHIHADKCNGSSLHVHWVQQGAFLKAQHEVVVSSLNGSDSFSVIVPANQTSVDLVVEPNTEYNVKVISGKGVCETFFPSDSKTVTSGYGVPGTVEVTKVGLEDDSCSVEWDYDKTTIWQIDQYVFTIETSLNVETGEKTEEPWSFNVPTENVKFSVFPNSNYSFTITAVSCAGSGKPKQIQGVCITDVAAPEVLKLEVDENVTTTSDDIYPSAGPQVRVAKPSQRNGPVSCIFVVVTIDDSWEKSSNRKVDANLNAQYLESIQKEDNSQYFAYATSNVKNDLSVKIGEGGKTNCYPQESSIKKRSIDSQNQTYNAINKRLHFGYFYRYYVLTTTPGDGTLIVKSSEMSPIIKTREQNHAWVSGVVVATILCLILIAILVILLRKTKDPAAVKDGQKNESSETVKEERMGEEDAKQETQEDIVAV